MRSGSVASVRWVSEGKYSSNGRLLIVMAPSPVRKRTRATARLRRPVDWTRGFAMKQRSFGARKLAGGGGGRGGGGTWGRGGGLAAAGRLEEWLCHETAVLRG